MAEQTSTQEITPTLEEVVRRRADLYQAILALERAAARPAVGREDEWALGVIEALDEVEREIVDHVEITERHDGLYDEIVDAAPRLSRNVQLLRAEHPQMQEATSALKARLEATPVETDGAGRRGARRDPARPRAPRQAPPARGRPPLGGVQPRHRRRRVTV